MGARALRPALRDVHGCAAASHRSRHSARRRHEAALLTSSSDPPWRTCCASTARGRSGSFPAEMLSLRRAVGKRFCDESVSSVSRSRPHPAASTSPCSFGSSTGSTRPPPGTSSPGRCTHLDDSRPARRPTRREPSPAVRSVIGPLMIAAGFVGLLLDDGEGAGVDDRRCQIALMEGGISAPCSAHVRSIVLGFSTPGGGGDEGPALPLVHGLGLRPSRWAPRSAGGSSRTAAGLSGGDRDVSGRCCCAAACRPLRPLPPSPRWPRSPSHGASRQTRGGQQPGGAARRSAPAGERDLPISRRQQGVLGCRLPNRHKDEGQGRKESSRHGCSFGGAAARVRRALAASGQMSESTARRSRKIAPW